MHSIAMRRLAALVLAALLVGAAAAAQEAPRTITVTGSGQIETAPDLATITAGVASEADNAATALAEAAAAMGGMLAAVEAAGIAPEDVQTTQLGLDPIWADAPEMPREDGPSLPSVVGYRASNMVSLRVRAVAELGGIIDAVTQAGANRLFGIEFALADPSARRDEARRLAMDDARAKAALLAEAAGVALGPVRTIREGAPQGGPMPLMAREQMAAMDMPTAGGSVAVQAQVEVVYGIE